VRLSPRYGDEPILRFETPLGDVAAPMLRQRTRLADLLAGLDDEQWRAPTRCARWTVQDVVAHLIGTDQFWTWSIAAALAGEPTRLLSAFDPVTTPEQMVEAVRERSTTETLDRFREGIDALAAVVTPIDDEQWSALGEAPPGHIALRAVVLHALWDAWIHERDIVLPLGFSPVEEPDEVILSLEYAAALSPSFLASTGSSRSATLMIEATAPDIAFAVDVGPTVVVRAASHDGDATVLAGPAVALLEALSLRTPFPQPVADADRWLLAGLATAFDTVV